MDRSFSRCSSVSRRFHSSVDSTNLFEALHHYKTTSDTLLGPNSKCQYERRERFKVVLADVSRRLQM